MSWFGKDKPASKILMVRSPQAGRGKKTSEINVDKEEEMLNAIVDEGYEMISVWDGMYYFRKK